MSTECEQQRNQKLKSNYEQNGYCACLKLLLLLDEMSSRVATPKHET